MPHRMGRHQGPSARRESIPWLFDLGVAVANHESRGTTITEERAVDELMVDHDALGNYVMRGDPDYKPTVYFLALHDGPRYVATNGVVGAASAREIIDGSSTSSAPGEGQALPPTSPT